jgi:hypothetical protein
VWQDEATLRRSSASSLSCCGHSPWESAQPQASAEARTETTAERIETRTIFRLGADAPYITGLAGPGSDWLGVPLTEAEAAEMARRARVKDSLGQLKAEATKMPLAALHRSGGRGAWWTCFRTVRFSKAATRSTRLSNSPQFAWQSPRSWGAYDRLGIWSKWEEEV